MARIERGLRIGLTETAAGILAAPLLGGLAAAFPPRVNFSVTVANTGRLVDELIQETLDTAIIHSVPPDDRLFYSDLLVEELVVVGGPASVLDPPACPIESPNFPNCRSSSRPPRPGSAVLW